MSTGTVRISEPTRQKLKQLAEHSGMTLSRTLEKAVDALRRQTMLEETNRAYEALRGDPQHWAEEQAERDAWDATLADGLEGD